METWGLDRFDQYRGQELCSTSLDEARRVLGEATFPSFEAGALAYLEAMRHAYPWEQDPNQETEDYIHENVIRAALAFLDPDERMSLVDEVCRHVIGTLEAPFHVYAAEYPDNRKYFFAAAGYSEMGWTTLFHVILDNKKRPIIRIAAALRRYPDIRDAIMASTYARVQQVDTIFQDA